MKKNIAVVYGGDSSEYVVSVKSKANVVEAIDKSLFKVWAVELKGGEAHVTNGDERIAKIDKADFSFVEYGEKVRFDFAYITIHGTPGENGVLQGYFDLIGLPYSCCGVQSAALTFNKFFCSNFLRSFGVPMAKQMRFFKGDTIDADEVASKLGLPAFVKPNSGGSSFGVTKVKRKEDIVSAIETAWKQSSDVLIEEFVEGTEFTCGLVKMKNSSYVFPVTETIPKNEFFDYDAKYNGQVEEITPARISPELTAQIQQRASEIYDLCECKGIARIDFILKNGVFHFLEVNTTPGMTATSFVPQQIAAMNKTLTEILTEIIVDGIGN
ncbi:MAG: D-alanine--D-alanine ligase [Mangrovibacterium sp.]